jgi:hypothetical protein
MRDQYDLESISHKPLSRLLRDGKNDIFSHTPLKFHSISDSTTRVCRIIKEILETERTYVSEMVTVYDIYYIPISLREILDKGQFEVLFSNFSTILAIHR